MKPAWLRLPLVAASLVLLGGLAPAQDRAGIEFFEKKIRPVLVEQCYQCHSAQAEKNKKLRGGLLLDSRAGLRKGGDNGTALVPGKPTEGTLLKALQQTGDLRMPPKGKLSDAVVADFEQWIRIGAPDPRDGTAVEAKALLDFDRARREHWAFQPPIKRPAPTVRQIDWPDSDIDRFTLARLESEGLKPNGPADKRELLRRASFGLLGLPPTPEEIEAFLRDESPDAFARVVDRLLASPRYGERWGRHWLDVARYAEDKALAAAQDSPHAFRYRDWVVQALNRDLAYDQFLRLQLAGDLVQEPAHDRFLRLAGLGFQGLGQLYHRGNFAEQVMADELDDRIDTVSRGLLGLTVSCARCHDHKYDPIPTRDYYSLAAAYQGSSLTILSLGSAAETERHARFTQELQQREAALGQWLVERARQAGVEQLSNLRGYLTAAWLIRARKAHGLPVDEKSLAAERKLSLHFLTRWVKLLEEREAGKNREALQAWHRLARESAEAPEARQANPTMPLAAARATDELCQKALELSAQFRQIEEAYQKELSASPADRRSKVRRRELSPQWQPLGRALLLQETAPFFVNNKEALALLDEAALKEHRARSEELEAFRRSGPPAPLQIHGVSGGGQTMKIHIRGSVERKGEEAPPGFLRILQKESRAASSGRFNRLDLAEAIVSRDNPLTARVLVNRVWHQHFGRGLVATPSNFGKLGEPPSHPELLDWLAVSFMENGWSLKWLHRQILLSRTYQLSSARNGVSEARDPENRLLWRWSPRRLDFEAWRDSVLVVSGRLEQTAGGPSQPVDNSSRRTLYSKISRSRLDPTLAVFDFPDANVSSEKRSVTTVAQQQLFVLNSGFMIGSAKALAARVIGTAADEDARIRLAYRLAFGREATAAELTLGRRYLASAVSDEKLTPWERYAQALLASNEFTWIP